MALSRARILATAVKMADRDGLDAVTLRRLAAALDVHVTSLYNHIADRDAITDGVVEVLVDEAKLPTKPRDWEDWVRRFVAAIGAVATKHPGAFEALQRRPVQGVGAARSFEAALECFAAAGFDANSAYAALKSTSYTALAVGLERSMASGGSPAQTDLSVLPVEDFPRIRAISADLDPEQTWEFAVDALVDGIRAQLVR